MPLLRARCESCKEPLGDPPHIALSITCSSCGQVTDVRMGADGQPADFDAAFDATRFMRWVASARALMVKGTIGVAVGSCTRCASALVLSSHAAMRLPCPHCGTPVTGEAAAVLVDQWPEPWTRIDAGSGSSSEYRIAVTDDRAQVAAGCAGCGAPTPPTERSRRCAQCGATTWIERMGPPEDPTPRLIQLGVRVDATLSGLPWKALLPLAQGEQVVRRDLAARASAASGSSLLGVTGIGCAIAVAVTTFLTVLIAVLVMHR